MGPRRRAAPLIIWEPNLARLSASRCLKYRLCTADSSCLLFLYFVPQTVGTTEGFWRLGKDIHECTGRSLAPVARQLLCTGCGLGEGQVALVHAKRSRAPLSTEKHTCFGTISFRSSSGPPLAQMPPRCLSDASQMPLRCLQMLPRCLQILPQKNCLGSRAGVIDNSKNKK